MLGEAILKCRTPPEIWINSSTATIYRHAEDRAMTENNGDIGIGAIAIKTETELILKSRWVIPQRLLQTGYVFRYPNIRQTIHNILKEVNVS